MAQAKVTLSNVEFIALKMFTHPGESGRFYRKALAQYKYPMACRQRKGIRQGDNNAEYFKPHCYTVGRYWIDNSVETVFDPMPFMSTRGGMYEKRKPRKSAWTLTEEGLKIAMRARAKITGSEAA